MNSKEKHDQRISQQIDQTHTASSENVEATTNAAGNSIKIHKCQVTSEDRQQKKLAVVRSPSKKVNVNLNEAGGQNLQFCDYRKDTFDDRLKKKLAKARVTGTTTNETSSPFNATPCNLKPDILSASNSNSFEDKPRKKKPGKNDPYKKCYEGGTFEERLKKKIGAADTDVIKINEPFVFKGPNPETESDKTRTFEDRLRRKLEAAHTSNQSGVTENNIASRNSFTGKEAKPPDQDTSDEKICHCHYLRQESDEDLQIPNATRDPHSESNNAVDTVTFDSKSCNSLDVGIERGTEQDFTSDTNNLGNLNNDRPLPRGSQHVGYLSNSDTSNEDSPQLAFVRQIERSDNYIFDAEVAIVDLQELTSKIEGPNAIFDAGHPVGRAAENADEYSSESNLQRGHTLQLQGGGLSIDNVVPNEEQQRNINEITPSSSRDLPMLEAWAVNEESIMRKPVFEAEVVDEDQNRKYRRAMKVAIAAALSVIVVVITLAVIFGESREGDDKQPTEDAPIRAVVCAPGFAELFLSLKPVDGFSSDEVPWIFWDQCTSNIFSSEGVSEKTIHQCIPSSKYSISVGYPNAMTSCKLYYNGIIQVDETFNGSVTFPFGRQDNCDCGFKPLTVEFDPNSGSDVFFAVREECSSTIIYTNFNVSIEIDETILITEWIKDEPDSSVLDKYSHIMPKGAVNYSTCLEDHLFYTFATRQLSGAGSSYKVTYGNDIVTSGIVHNETETTFFGEDVDCDNCPDGQKLFSLQLKLDSNGFETGWSLVADDCLNTARILSGFSYFPSESVNVNKCLDNNMTYTFTIYDFGFDGICCEFGVGSFTATFGGKIVASGGTFNDYSSVNFGAKMDCWGDVLPTFTCPLGQRRFTLELRNDINGGQTGWVAVNSCNGSTVLSSPDIPYLPFELTRETHCLEDAALNFTVFDYSGKGILTYGAGYYLVYYDSAASPSFETSDDGHFFFYAFEDEDWTGLPCYLGYKFDYFNSVLLGENSSCPSSQNITTICNSDQKLFSLDLVSGLGDVGWSLVDSCTYSTILRGNATCFEGDRSNYCIPKGDYIFFIHNPFGDGVCCEKGNGHYKISYDGTLVATGTDFGYFDRISFGDDEECDYSDLICPTGYKVLTCEVLSGLCYGTNNGLLLYDATRGEFLFSVLNFTSLQSVRVSLCLSDETQYFLQAFFDDQSAYSLNNSTFLDGSACVANITNNSSHLDTTQPSLNCGWLSVMYDGQNVANTNLNRGNSFILLGEEK